MGSPQGAMHMLIAMLISTSRVIQEASLCCRIKVSAMEYNKSKKIISVIKLYFLCTTSEKGAIIYIPLFFFLHEMSRKRKFLVDRYVFDLEYTCMVEIFAV